MQNTVSDIRLGQQTVGVTAVQIAAVLSDGNKAGLLIKSHGTGDAAANTAPIFIGYDNQVTASSGFSLAPGESVVVPFSGAIWAISTSASQVVSFIEA